MRRTWLPVLLVLAAVVGVSAVAVPAAAEQVGSVEMQEGTETTSPTETTTTPADGSAGHADDPFPSWLPLLFAGGLLVGIAVVGGGLWFVVARVREFLGR